MHRHRTPRALQRSQWFQDLTTALAEAEKLLAMLEADGGFPGETARLRVRVQAVRSELELLNRVALGEGRVVGPGWPEAKAGGG
jgi:hypothetical protein